ncbi:longevity-assurance protein [Clavulina sp. PMI_390]|nr:longevity-assurance protein [Clavulina sp. PMI_390]
MYPDGLGPLNTDAYWTYFPHTPLPGPIKAYYFLAFAFYATQVVILNIEEHRSDHWQMFTHHVVTVGLIAYSYGTHLTRPGCAILVLLDFCDIFLPAAKMVKYMRIPVLPDVFFVIFLVSWFITRQVLLLKIILSVTLDMPRQLDLIWKPEEQRYVTYGSYLFFTISLWILYALLCVWFGLGCKVAWNVIRGQGASEVRSDDEDDESDEVSTPALSRTQSKED